MSRTKNPAKGVIVALLGALLAALLLIHELIPTTNGIALVVESTLPWTWVLLVLLLLLAFIRLSPLSIIGVLIPALVWGVMFGPYLKPASDDRNADLIVATHNVGARLPQPTATARSIIDQNPDVVVVQEIESLSGKIIKKELDKSFEYTQVADTVGVWSRWPLSKKRNIDLGLQWPRAFETTVQSDHGDVTLYAVHVPSVRPGVETLRNSALQKLSSAVKQEDSEHLIVAGDFNAVQTDRYFKDLDDQLLDSRKAVGGGFGFTWPARFPAVRLDHIMVRGLDPVYDTVMDRGTSDHRAVIAGLNLTK